MFSNKSVSAFQFEMTPRADIPRARFNIQFTHKTTFQAGILIPVMCEEVLPGDHFECSMTAFARLATPIFPLMDNIHLDTFFFFVPNRLVWDNWVKFMGEQKNPGDSISYVVPTVTSPVGGFPAASVFDYFGLPTVGQVDAGSTVTVNALPLRGYNLIYNEWFRDQNLINSRPVNTGDGPDPQTDFVGQRRAKRPDYFTTALPWPQKGNTSVSLPLGTAATVKTSSSFPAPGASPAIQWAFAASGSNVNFTRSIGTSSTGLGVSDNAASSFAAGSQIFPANLYADLSTATAATINQLRQAFQIQKLLERDARGGTRYAEIVRSHFGVISPDARLQRPEYLGGGSTPMMLTPIAQTSATSINGSTSPLGNLAAMGTVVGRHGFNSSFTEHGYVIGLVNVRADVTYQQGLRRHWRRSTRYDYYWPAFAMLGEQAIRRQEIYCLGQPGDETTFGYQERWAELRYAPSMITGLFRSTTAGTLDAWHLAQRFAAPPANAPQLNQAFIEENPPMERVLAVPSANAHVLFDSRFELQATRPLPLYSVPGLLDHF